MIERQSHGPPRLRDDESLVSIPLARSNQVVMSKQMGSLRMELATELASAVQEISERCGVTSSSVLLALWGGLLHRYTDAEEVLLYTLGGTGNDAASAPCCVPLRVPDLHPDTSFIQILSWITQEEQVTLGLERVGQAYPEQVGAMQPLLFVCESSQSTATLECYDHYGELIVCTEAGIGLCLHMRYDARLYTEAYVRGIACHYEKLGLQALQHPERSIQSFELLSWEEGEMLLRVNDTAMDYPLQSIGDLFRAQVQQSPLQTAVVYGEQLLSYQQLDESSDRIAAYLLSRGLVQGMRVGLIAERTPSMLVAIIGMLKAGMTYVPIDPQYPGERIEFMLNDSSCAYIVADEVCSVAAQQLGREVLQIEHMLQYTNEEELDKPFVSPAAPAYMMYTSGSTGQPKGILTTHCNIVRTVRNCGYIELHAQDKLLQLSNYAFDGSTFDIFGALLNGAQLVLTPKSVLLDASLLAELIRTERITVAFMTTALFNVLTDMDVACFEPLRKLLFGGETASVKHVRRCLDYMGDHRLIHVYGPTETTVFATFYPVDHRIYDMDYVPIGRPIHNTTVYVVNKLGQLQPVGVPGELWIGGDGTAIGYVNRDDLTSSKFVDSPFITGERLYKTGDRVRWTNEGQLEFIERMDQQVKIRGYRIEMGEVEKQLQRLELVKEAIVTAGKDDSGHAYLCAYYIPNANISVSELKSRLSAVLPAYMVPDCFMAMEKFPLTPNGKINKRALPAPVRIDIRPYEAPATETEAALAELWQSVLAVGQVSRYAHFFELGGQSLKAMMLLAQVREQFQVTLPVAEIFDKPVLLELAATIETISDGTVLMPLDRAEYRSFYPATSAQKAMFALQQLAPASCSYNITSAYRIIGRFHPDQLERVLQALARRHESLRTSFQYMQGEPVQIIHDELSFQLERYEAGHEEEAAALVQQFIRPFDLSKTPLFRAGCIQLGSSDEYIVVLDFHHIICDGISLNIVHRELSELYKGLALPELDIQVKDYAVWQQKLLMTPMYEAKQVFWQGHLGGELPLLNMPTDRPRPTVRQSAGSRYRVKLGARRTEGLRQLSRQCQSTLFMTLLSLYQVILSKYGDQSEVVIGTPVAGRLHSAIDSLIGMFVNTIALRLSVRRNQTFMEIVSNVKDIVLQAFEHADYPFDKVQEKLGCRRDPSRHPVFDAMLVLQNMDSVALELADTRVERIFVSGNETRFDLTWEFYEGVELELYIEYSTVLFEESTITRMSEHLLHVIDQVIECPDMKLGELELVNDTQREQLLVQFNDTDQAYPSQTTVHQLFEQQAARTPDETAVLSEGRTVTYRQLNQLANTLARRLREKHGVKRDQFVGMLLDKSVEMVAAVLAVLKAGAAYIPIDPTYPEERIQYMLTDSGAELLLVDEGGRPPSSYAGSVLEVKRMEGWLEEDCSNLESVNAASDLAYMIYTSGSTGQPKGVMIEHQGLCNFALLSEAYGIQSKGRVLQFAPFSFDASAAELIHTLLSGATLIVEKKEVFLSNLVSFLQERQVTSVTLPPSLLKAVDVRALPELKTIVTAGEACSMELVERWGEGRTFINAYGPTEATIGSTYGVLVSGMRTAVIGKPIPNKKLYVVNADYQLQPIGVPGELWIGGAGIARGYWNKPELTAERFITNPFGEGRIYRTGDMVRWLPDGTLEFLGRIDHQVKINGYRIELDEIVEALLRHPGISDAIVIDWKRGNQVELAAYITVYDRLEEREIRAYLRQALPAYMIPASFIVLPYLPLTPNLKVDRTLLPEPRLYAQQETRYRVPQNELESMLAAIWEEVLNIPRVGIDDHYLELGGDSIKGIQMAARLNHLGYKLDIQQLFQYSTIAELAPHVKLLTHSISQEPVIGAVELTPIQRWFFGLDIPNKSHWNQSMILPSEQGWEEVEVRTVLRKLTEHHDALRMTFRLEGTRIEPYNQGLEHDAFALRVYALDVATDIGLTIEREANKLQRGMNLEEGPLLQACIFQTNRCHYLLLAIHHLVIDAVSWRILLEDFHTLVGQLQAEQPLLLPLKTDSYVTWSHAIMEYRQTPFFESERRYWQRVEERLQGANMLQPTARCTVRESRRTALTLGEHAAAELLGPVHRAFGTEANDIWLSALALTVQACLGHSTIVIHMEGHGREALHQELNVTRTVGWFTSLYPVIIELPSDRIAETIVNVKNSLREIPNKGMGYNMMISQQSGEALLRAVTPALTFNYLGRFDNGAALNGIGASYPSTGDSIDPATPMLAGIDIVAAVVEEQLHIVFTYDPSQYTVGQMSEFVSVFHRCLDRIRSHCLEQREQVLTSSDFSATGLDQDELELFLNTLE
ncbi:non-ribosomal peptide synthetase [Paenibacillus sp. YYML68]|uniref:non-ribosomal peptide synthetase n=1 Tax=Paenibacillus sp. YYML68 TaxID=2909250 RepID=UPI002490B1F9|nr:non-ribosomal peptide synthetase [Paenibacillus sp. YYML68]